MTRFAFLVGLCSAILAGAVLTAVLCPPPWSWAVGLVYLAYDSWLLWFMVRASRRALHTPPTLPRPGRRLSLAVVIAVRDGRLALPQTLDAILAQADRPDEIVIADDASTDGTRQLIARRYAGRGIRVLPLSRRGKARCLNAALNHAASDLFVTLDADTIIAPGAIAALRRAFQADRELAAGCGVLRPVCRPGRLARAFQLHQTFEHLRTLLWRISWSRDQTLVLVSGAFAAFRRSRLVAVGGFDPNSLVEDYEVMFRLHRASLEHGLPLKTRVIAGACATTRVPGDARAFLRQHTRWFTGHLQTLFRNADMVGQRRYGRLGTLHLPLKTVDMLLPVFGLASVAALIAQLAAGQRPSGLILAALVFKLAFDLACHTYALALHAWWQGQRVTVAFALRTLAATLTEPLGFQLLRQVGAVLGWMAFLRGRVAWAPQRTHAADPRRAA